MSALLPDGTLNARPNALPDQTKKTTRSAAWTMPPATLFRPTPATAVAGSTPDFAQEARVEHHAPDARRRDAVDERGRGLREHRRPERAAVVELRP